MHIGETLREAREAKSLTLDDIQDLTKIQKRYLVAIEQNDFHVLPGRFYARAFIKEYAQAVDLDASELLAEFDEDEIETEHDQEEVQYSRLERTKAPQSVRSTSVFSLIPTVIVVVLVIGIIFITWTFLQKSSNNSEQNQAVQNDDEIIRDVEVDKRENNNEDVENEEDDSDEKKEKQDDKKDKAEKDEEGTFSVLEEGTGASPLSTMEFTHRSDKLEVSFEAEEDSYVELKGANDNVYYSSTLTKDTEIDVFDVSDEEKVYFNIGYAPAITIKINGVALDYPVDKNEKVHQKVWVNFVKE